MGFSATLSSYGHSINHFVEAKTYLEMLRDHDNRPGALYGLGTIYHEGLGVKVSLTMAEAYYQEAADQGHVMALRNLSQIVCQKSKVRGFLLWLKACALIFITVFNDRRDPRLGIF